MSYDTFKGVTNINDIGFSKCLENNIIDFIDWSLVKINGFYNVKLTNNSYGPNLSELKPVKQDNYFSYGKVWQSQRENWVWESGINNISGIYVNSTFYPVGSTGLVYQINYRDGQILFNSAIPASSVVKLEYLYKLFDVRTARDQWMQDVIQSNWITDNRQFYQIESGVFNILAQNRVSLPVVAVEVIDRESLKPLQIGGGQIITKPCIVYIMGTDELIVSNVTDYIVFQNDRRIYSYDINRARASGVFKYNFNGTVNNKAQTYKQLVDNFYWKTLTLKNMRSEHIADKPLYIKSVRFDIEADFPEI